MVHVSRFMFRGCWFPYDVITVQGEVRNDVLCRGEDAFGVVGRGVPESQGSGGWSSLGRGYSDHW